MGVCLFGQRSRMVSVLALLFGVCVLAASAAAAQGLRPTRQSLDRQNEMALAHKFTYIDNERQLRSFVEAGILVPVASSLDLEVLESVSFPFARPEVADLLAELGRAYRKACEEPLGVTSLTRPRNRQPRNASPRSVHPTGMAFDLRRSGQRTCRAWLDDTLLSLEDRGLVEAAVEYQPHHYHVALFPREYQKQVSADGEILSASAAAMRAHIVHVGDTLWKIAQRYGTTVGVIKQANGLRSNTIRPGQKLTVPER